MEAIKSWAIGICMAAIVAGLFTMLFPSGSMEKMIRIVISAFFICCLIAPFLSQKEFKIELEAMSSDSMSANEDALQEKLNEQTINSAGAQVEVLIKSELEKNNYKFDKISAEMDIDDSNRIFIKEVVLELPSDEYKNRKAIHDLLYTQLGVDAEIRMDGES